MAATEKHAGNYIFLFGCKKKRAKIMVNILLLIYGCKRYINCNLNIFSHLLQALVTSFFECKIVYN